MNYYQFHLGDYAAHTRHLSLLEDLAYRRMIDLYYTTEAPLPLDEDRIARLIGMRDHMREVSDVLSDFFVKSEKGYTNARCDKEIESYKAKADRAKAANKSRWAASKSDDRLKSDVKSDLKSENNQIPTNNQEPLTNNHKEHPPTPRKRGSGFDASMIDLPEWLDREDWQSWVADRKARKKPVTEEGARRQLQQLASYRADGHKPADVIANSIAGGYQGLFPPRGQIRASPPSRAQAMAEWNAELGEVLAEGRQRTVIDMGTIDATH